MVNAYGAFEQGGILQPYEYEPGPLGSQQVDIQVTYCGICHSDLSMIQNEWGMTQYPFVPGHEIAVKVLGFVARHTLVPQTEVFPFAQVNEALDKLRSQPPPYRLVLKC